MAAATGLEPAALLTSMILEGSTDSCSPRFRGWYNHATPESEKLPLDWSQLDRPDKAVQEDARRPFSQTDQHGLALGQFPANDHARRWRLRGLRLDVEFCADSQQSLADSTPQTPIYFILSPGADVVADLDKIAAEQDPPFVNGENYFNVSMGQGQDVIAMSYLECASQLVVGDPEQHPPHAEMAGTRKETYSFGDHSHDNFRSSSVVIQRRTSRSAS